MNVNLIDFDGKIPNLALMKASTYYKQQGDTVSLNALKGQFDIVLCSVLYTWNKDRASKLRAAFPNIQFGGTGWDLTTTMPVDIRRKLEQMGDLAAEINSLIMAKQAG